MVRTYTYVCLLDGDWIVTEQRKYDDYMKWKNKKDVRILSNGVVVC